MSRLLVRGFSISLDGFAAGSRQSREEPLGRGGEQLHEWLVATRTFKTMIGQEGGSVGTDEDLARLGFENVGAWIMGRNMFGPIRGPWGGDPWSGWWGDNPPYHSPAFILTHHPREPLEMEGGTVFHFVTRGIMVALDRARAAADGKDIRLLGGASVIRQYLRAGAVDEMHLAVSPVLLGEGEHLFHGLDLPALGYTCQRPVSGEKAAHYVVARQAESSVR